MGPINDKDMKDGCLVIAFVMGVVCIFAFSCALVDIVKDMKQNMSYNHPKIIKINGHEIVRNNGGTSAKCRKCNRTWEKLPKWCHQ